MPSQIADYVNLKQMTIQHTEKQMVLEVISQIITKEWHIELSVILEFLSKKTQIAFFHFVAKLQ